ncbi:hypothetical protein [Massilia genomosp. 1]|uniref:Uncharacterized protein n=1 Tax=Massilia genomosp. 1 TaxID=2609280 RepID=A0ABX0MFG7_9BURK|nr:hypothetical protein [Massilia genomosp. 1]NHZ61523.1 hypothetical protein [Massilia genomosp. 1]
MATPASSPRSTITRDVWCGRAARARRWPCRRSSSQPLIERADLLENIRDDLLAQLEAHFGPADDACDHIGATGLDGESGWAFALPVALPGTGSGAPHENRLWLTIWTQGDSGDGNTWNEIWLTCAPTPDALAAALRARAA